MYKVIGIMREAEQETMFRVYDYTTHKIDWVLNTGDSYETLSTEFKLIPRTDLVPIYDVNKNVIENNCLTIVAVVSTGRKIIVADAKNALPYMIDYNVFCNYLQEYKCSNGYLNERGCPILSDDIPVISKLPSYVNLSPDFIKKVDVLFEKATLLNLSVAEITEKVWNTLTDMSDSEKVLTLIELSKIKPLHFIVEAYKAEDFDLDNIDKFELNVKFYEPILSYDTDVVWVSIADDMSDYHLIRCHNLKGVQIAEGLEFSKYVNGNDAYEIKHYAHFPPSVAYFDIPESTTLIPNGAFKNSTEHKLKKIPPKVKYIGDKAFGGTFISDMFVVPDSAETCFGSALLTKYAMANTTIYIGKNVRHLRKFKHNEEFKNVRNIVVMSPFVVSTQLLLTCIQYGINLFVCEDSKLATRIVTAQEEGLLRIRDCTHKWDIVKKKLEQYSEDNPGSVTITDITNSSSVELDLESYMSDYLQPNTEINVTFLKAGGNKEAYVAEMEKLHAKYRAEIQTDIIHYLSNFVYEPNYVEKRVYDVYVREIVGARYYNLAYCCYDYLLNNEFSFRACRDIALGLGLIMNVSIETPAYLDGGISPVILLLAWSNFRKLALDCKSKSLIEREALERFEEIDTYMTAYATVLLHSESKIMEYKLSGVTAVGLPNDITPALEEYSNIKGKSQEEIDECWNCLRNLRKPENMTGCLVDILGKEYRYRNEYRSMPFDEVPLFKHSEITNPNVPDVLEKVGYTLDPNKKEYTGEFTYGKRQLTYLFDFDPEMGERFMQLKFSPWLSPLCFLFVRWYYLAVKKKDKDLAFLICYILHSYLRLADFIQLSAIIPALNDTTGYCAIEHVSHTWFNSGGLLCDELSEALRNEDIVITYKSSAEKGETVIDTLRRLKKEHDYDLVTGRYLMTLKFNLCGSLESPVQGVEKALKRLMNIWDLED